MADEACAKALRDHPALVDSRHTEGPFVLVATDTRLPDEPPEVVAPPGGFATKAEALQYVESFAGRKTPYLGLRFHLVRPCTPAQFTIYCSWED